MPENWVCSAFRKATRKTICCSKPPNTRVPRRWSLTFLQAHPGFSWDGVHFTPSSCYSYYIPGVPNPAPEWQNYQKSHLGEGPTKAKGYLRPNMWQAHLHLTSSWSFNQVNVVGTQELVAVCVLFCIVCLSLSSSNSLFFK